jgi:hypothetical protein
MTGVVNENSKKSMPKDEPEMTAKDVIEIVQLFEQHNIDVI